MKIDEINRRLILKNVSGDTNNEIIVSPEMFQKAVTELGLETYDEDSLNTYKREIRKAMSSGKFPADELEKAQKNLGKLRKMTIIDKKGKRTTVYVKQGEEQEKIKEKKTKTKDKQAEESKEVVKETPKKKSGESNPDEYWSKLTIGERTKMVSANNYGHIWRHASFSKMPQSLQDSIKEQMKSNYKEVMGRETPPPPKNPITSKILKEQIAKIFADAEKRKTGFVDSQGEFVAKKKEEKKIEYSGNVFSKGDKVLFSVDKNGNKAEGVVEKHGKDKLGEYVKIKYNGKTYIRYPNKIEKVGGEKKTTPKEEVKETSNVEKKSESNKANDGIRLKSLQIALKAAVKKGNKEVIKSLQKKIKELL